MLLADGAAMAASRSLCLASSETGSDEYFLMLRRLKIISILITFITFL